MEPWNSILKGLRCIDKYYAPEIRVKIKKKELRSDDILYLENKGWQVKEREAIFNVEE